MDGQNEQWEHYIEYIRADTQQQQTFMREHYQQPSFHRYDVRATLPRLNELGTQGWELVHMQPVLVGEHGDICISRGDARTWTNNYLCVFKRRKR